MQALRTAKKRREVAALTAVDTAVPAGGQLHLPGEEFASEEEYDAVHKDELRRRCQTDLFFLCKEILGRDVTERTHGPVFEFLGNPDPDRPLEGQPDPIRERIWLDPRGTFKTSLLNDLAVQYTVCFREIRILFLGGEKSLALGSLDTYTEIFVIRGEPTRFQRLFPEFCIHPGGKYEKKYVAPCRRNPKRNKEPTAWSNSTDSALSGWHPDLLIPDDVVNDENAENFVRISKVKKVFYQAMQLLEPVWGRMVFGGTRYHPSDLGGELMAEASPKRKFMVRAALRARPELPQDRREQLEKQLRDVNVPSTEFHAADWELLFPERLTFENLMAERGPSLEKFAVFGSQKLNDPIVATGRPTFLLQDLREASVPANQIPAFGRMFIEWDLAYSLKRGRDYYVGVAGLVDANGRAFITEVLRGRFVTHEIVYHIVDMIRRWNPELTDIEDTMGARYLLSDLNRLAMEMGVALKIDWFPVDSSPAAMDGRVKACESALHDKRLFFSNGIGCMDELYEEFCDYGVCAHHDIASTIAQLVVRHLPWVTEGMPAPESPFEQAEEKRRMELHAMIYRAPDPGEPPPAENPYALEEVMPGLDG
jgi:hypothetical protein